LLPVEEVSVVVLGVLGIDHAVVDEKLRVSVVLLETTDLRVSGSVTRDVILRVSRRRHHQHKCYCKLPHR